MKVHYAILKGSDFLFIILSTEVERWVEERIIEGN